MKLVLTATDVSLANAWRDSCGDLPFVEIVRGSILDVTCDAVVSPANSFGFMDGGLDAVYMMHFGEQIQTSVRRQIYEHHQGELLVGQADIVETGDGKIPFLICAPTMRVPMVLKDSVNPYLAARATFLLISRGTFRSGAHKDSAVSSKVQVVALPGLGTGVGRVSPSTCAKQVRSAIDDVILGKSRMPKSWAEASEKHQLLYTSKPTRLQY